MTYNQTAFQYVLDGQYMVGVQAMFFNAMQFWWIVLLIAFSVFILYISTKDWTVTTGVTLVGYGFFDNITNLVPTEISFFVYMVVSIGLALSLYVTFGKSYPGE